MKKSKMRIFYSASLALLGAGTIATIPALMTSCSNKQHPTIAASSAGTISAGATITVQLFDGADWSKVSCSDASWTKGTGTDYKFTKTDPTAKEDQEITITLQGSNSVSFAIPCGNYNDITHPSIAASFVGTLIDGAVITVQLIDGADWSKVNCSDTSWTKSTGTNHTFTKAANPSAVGDQEITIALQDSNSVTFTIPCGSSDQEAFFGYVQGTLNDDITYDQTTHNTYIQLQSANLDIKSKAFSIVAGELPGNGSEGTLALDGTTTDTNGRIYFIGKAITGGDGYICIKISDVICKMYIKVYDVPQPTPPTPSFEFDIHGIINDGTDMDTTTTIWIDIIPINLPSGWRPVALINGTFENNLNYGLTFQSNKPEDPQFVGGPYRSFGIGGTANLGSEVSDQLCRINFTTRYINNTNTRNFDSSSTLAFYIYK